MNLLGIKISEVTLAQARERILEFLSEHKVHTVFTPNPEMLVDAQHDAYFKKVLNQGDLNLCDGFGLRLVAPKLHRIPGIDFMLEICGIAEELGKSIYLLGSGDKFVIENTKKILQTKFPNLKIVGIEPGYPIALAEAEQGSILHYNENDRDETLGRIIMAAPDILFVAFGHNKQEKWIVENAPNLPSVKIAMGVGGAFDYLSGKIKRAPKFIRAIGLEWLWRLIREPKRFKRIWKAVIVFPVSVFRRPT